MISDRAPVVAAMLVSLDCILDVRQGTLSSIDPQLFLKAIKAGYFQRTKDVFPDIDKDTYNSAYAKRGAEALSLSMMTQVPALIKDFVEKQNLLKDSGPYEKVPRVDINFYPFDMPEHIRESIVKAVQALINDRVEMSAVYYADEHLSFDFIRHAYDHVVMYDAGPWLETQSEEGIRRAIPHVTIISPLLDRGESGKDFHDLMQGAVDVAEYYAPLFNLVLLPVEIFSSAFNPYKIEASTPQPEGQEVQEQPEAEQSVVEQPFPEDDASIFFSEPL